MIDCSIKDDNITAVVSNNIKHYYVLLGVICIMNFRTVENILIKLGWFELLNVKMGEFKD